jgi:hypothetical protein
MTVVRPAAFEGTSVARLAPMTHPRLISADRISPHDYARSDSLFVLLLLSAVMTCTIIPFALL